MSDFAAGSFGSGVAGGLQLRPEELEDKEMGCAVSNPSLRIGWAVSKPSLRTLIWGSAVLTELSFRLSIGRRRENGEMDSRPWWLQL